MHPDVVDHERKMRRFIAIVSWLPILFFGPSAWFFAWSPAWECHDSADWVVTPCVITIASSRPGSDGYWYNDLKYDYVFSGASYQSNRLAFSSSDSGRGPGHLSPLPVLGNSICYVNPNHPSRAVLRREYDEGAFWLLTALAAVGAMFGLIWARFLRSGKPLPKWDDKPPPKSFFKGRAVVLAVLLLWSLSGETSAVAADLEFKTTALELNPPFDATQVTATWEFRWVGKHDVKLRIVPSCDCVKAITDQAIYHSGDSGIISAEFNTGFKTGTANYSYDIFAEDDLHPTHLSATIHFHPLFSAATLAAKWTVGGAIETRTLPITVLEGIQLTQVDALDDPQCPFNAKATLTENGDGFIVRITPRDHAAIEKPGLTPIVIRTDHSVTARRDITVYAWVLSAVNVTEPSRK